MKRVQVSNQTDILAELDGLRRQASSRSGRFERSAREVDLDTLLSGSDRTTRELKRKVEKALNSDIFKRMRDLHVDVQIRDGQGEVIHTMEPVYLAVDDAETLRKLCVRITVDLENLK